MTRRGLVAVVIACMLSQVAVAGDWPFWRGPEQNGASREPATVTSWSQDGENVLWKQPVGGRTTPVVMQGRVFAVTPVGTGEGRQERVICLDAETGKTIWEHRFNVFHTDIVENRVGWTAVVGDPETGNIYAHGTGGEMFCFDRDGKVLWKVSMTEELGRISGYGGRLHTPIIDENRVIVSFLSSSWGKFAKPAHRYVAFDKRTGEILWWAAPGGKPLDTTYSVPVVAVIDGVRQLIAGNADGGVYGMKARTGERLWGFQLSKRGLNVSAVVHGNYVYIGHSEENLDNTEMGRVVCIDARKRGDITTTGEVWRFPDVTAGYSSPAIANGRLYVVDNSANLFALDLMTGKKYWKYEFGRVGKGSPAVTADGVIYIGGQTGNFHILKDEGNKCVEIDREVFTREDKRVDEMYGSPAISDGRVYFMTRYNTYCLGAPGRRQVAVDIPPLAPEIPPSTGGDRFLHVEPAEITLHPGELVKLKALITGPSARRFRGLSGASWSVKGVKGSVSPDGTFVAGQENAFSAGVVTVTGENLSAAARVRVTPTLPIHEDFENMPLGKAPPGWVGAVVKTKIDERDGSHVLRKLASKKRPSPPFMRLRCYATPSIAGGYTVAADLLGTPKKRFKPDMGLINSRYRMIVMGRNKIRIESWSPMPRFRHDVRFSWKTEQWYRVKFQVKLEGDHAIVRGKVWLRDSEEPSDWMIEAVDAYPNREGSAGVYAYSTNTTAKSDGPEVFYDNFQVTRND